ncbi:MAG: hypothetical protein ACREAA_12010 [Candidatus Polarisedimenticolia bacterium]
MAWWLSPWRRSGQDAVAGPDLSAERALAASPAAFEAYQQGASLASADPAAALSLFRKAATLDASFAPARYRLALAAVLVDDDREATPAIRAALEAGDRLPEAYRTAARPLGFLVDGDFARMPEALGAAQASHPDDPDLHLMAALAARSCEQFDPASVIEHAAAVLRTAPEDVAAGGLLIEAAGMLDRPLAEAGLPAPGNAAAAGQAALWRGDFDAAIEAVDEVLRAGGDVLAAGLAPAFILTGDPAQVRAMDDSEMEPHRTTTGNATALLHAGINEMGDGQLTLAAELFERGAEYARAPWRRAEAAGLLLLAARARRLEGRGAEEASAIQAARALVGKLGIVEHALALSRLAAGDPAGAAAIAAGLDAEDPWRRLVEGEIALAGGDTRQAVEAVQAAWAMKRASPADCVAVRADAIFLDALGRALLAAGRTAEAKDAFGQVTRLGMRGLRQPDLMARAARAIGDP